VPALSAQFPYRDGAGIDLLVALLFAAALIMGPADTAFHWYAAISTLGCVYQRGVAGCAAPWLLPRAIGAARPAIAAALERVGFAAPVSGAAGRASPRADGVSSWAIVYQWDSFTGGSNGWRGVAADWLAEPPTHWRCWW
jgi:branched-chain amino acid transport system permease protein